MLSERIHDAITQSAAVFIMPDMGTIVVRGPDRLSWLNSLVTADVQAVRSGVVGYGLTLAKVGRILSDLWIASANDQIVVGLPKDRVSLVCEHLDRHLIMEDATIEDATGGHQWVFTYGARALGLCQQAASLYEGIGGSAPALPGEGAALVIPAARVTALQDDLASAAITSSAPTALGSETPRPELPAWAGAVLGTRDEWDLLRLHLLVPRFGIDFGDKNYPQEAWLEKTAVSFSKGCYLGQEVVCRLEMRGHVSRRLAALRLEGTSLPAVGAGVRARNGDANVGSVSGAFMSRRLAAPVALGMVSRTHMDLGSEVRVGEVPAVVIDPAQARDYGASAA